MNHGTANDDLSPSMCPSAAVMRLSPVAGEPGVYQTRHDMTTDGLSVTVSQAVAELSGVPATELVSDFSEYADPDAFDRLFRASVADARTDGFVTLFVRDYRVTVHGDGRILVEDES